MSNTTFKDRLINEKTELDEKLTKLTLFIETNPDFNSLPGAQMDLLLMQASVMTTYSRVLDARLHLL